METLLGKTIEELQSVALGVGLPKFAGKQLAEWLYVRRAVSFDEMTNISLKGRETLKAGYTIGRHTPVREAVSIDGTHKYLFEIKANSQEPIANSQFIESVYIPEDERATLCVSTQAGCKMGCRFCMTGTLGFHGHLSAAEILNQIFEIDALAVADGRQPITNIVYMGEGEPMDNIENVLRSLEIMTAPYGCAWSPKRITVSTVGVPAMKRFLDESECHLAVSLHNPFPIERAQIMPAERMMPLADVIALLKQYDWSHQRRVSFEYICWAGKNDSPRGRSLFTCGFYFSDLRVVNLDGRELEFVAGDCPDVVAALGVLAGGVELLHLQELLLQLVQFPVIEHDAGAIRHLLLGQIIAELV